MCSPRAKFSVRHARWLALAGLVAVAPKCLVCLLGYAGLGAALGLAGPEFCGAPESSSHSWLIGLGAAALVIMIGLSLLVILKHRRACAASAAPR